MKSYQELSVCLDKRVWEIAKISEHVPFTGLMTGKTGIAILLYHYARFKNEPALLAYADRLLELTLQEINPLLGKGFDEGLSGIAWGFNYLIKNEFIQVDEDFLEDIDAVLFQDEDNSLEFWDLNTESEKGLYLLSRIDFSTSAEDDIWRERLEKCVQNLRNILMHKYTHHELLVYPCRTLIRFFYVCRALRGIEPYRPALDALFNELTEIVNISFHEEKNVCDKLLLASMLTGFPVFERCYIFSDVPPEMTLPDVMKYYLTLLFFDQSISIPEAVEKTFLSSLIEQRYPLSNPLSPYNAGLHYHGRLDWSLFMYLRPRT